jgi:hypothetical protein
MASLRKRADAQLPDPVPLVVDPPETPSAPAVTATVEQDATQALKQQIEALRQAEALQQAHGRRVEWLQSTPLAQKVHVDQLGVLHGEAVGSGLADTSPEYFRFMEERLAALHAQEPSVAAERVSDDMKWRAALARAEQQPQKPEPRQASAYVSAPVSRPVPGGQSHSRTTLTPLEIDAAKTAGVSTEEYARQKLRYQGMRESGEYSEQPRR